MIKKAILGIALLILPVMSLSIYSTSEAEDVLSLKKTSRTFARVAKNATKAVVNIGTVKTVRQDGYYNFFGDDSFRRFFQFPQREFEQRGLGSGVIVSKKGYILTNNHVVEGVDETLRQRQGLLTGVRRAHDDLVVDVREVTDEGDVPLPVAEVAHEGVEDDHGPGVADVAVVVDGHPADIEPDLARIDRRERLDLP